MSLPISSAASLDSTTLAASDLLPVLDVSASAGNKGSNITATELATALLGLYAKTPIILSAKNVTVLTSGAPADIASISVPSWVTRWMLVGSSVGATSRLIAESAAGSLSAATFAVYDGSGGAGNVVSSGSITGPSSANLGTLIGAAAPGTLAFSTSSTIYIRQTANSANAGTCSFYLAVFPFL